MDEARQHVKEYPGSRSGGLLTGTGTIQSSSNARGVGNKSSCPVLLLSDLSAL